MTLQSLAAYVIRPFLIFVALVGLVLGLTTLSARHWQMDFFLVTLGASAWGYPVLLIGDIWAARTGKIPEYHRRFYGEVERDLWVAGASGVVIVFLYLLSSTRYEASSFDIVSASVPLLVMGTHTIVSVTQMGLANMPIKRAYKWGMLMYMTGISAVVLYVSVHVASGTYGLISSTWLQVTILCLSLFIFVESRRIQFVLEQAELQPSPTFSAVFGALGPYELIARLAPEWNREVATKLREGARSSDSIRADHVASEELAVNPRKQPPPLPQKRERKGEDP